MIRGKWSSRSLLAEQTECKVISLFLVPVTASHCLLCRFRWVFCQLEVLRHCLPASICQTLDQLPKSLDDTYLRVLSQIPQANQVHAHRMLQCLLAAVRPLRVEELAELLAFDFGVQGEIPKYCPALRLDDQTQAVLSTCSSLVTITDNYGRRVQFSHFAVKEFLRSNRLASLPGDISHYHIRIESAHTILTQACLGLLLHLDDKFDTDCMDAFPLVNYAATHWVEHAHYEGVASHIIDGMETLLDPDKPHFVAWLTIYDIDWHVPGWYNFAADSNPLYYSVLCGFYDLVRHVAIKHPHLVNAAGGRYKFPLLAALALGEVEIAELLLEHGADVDAREARGMTALLSAFPLPQVDILNIVEFLLEHDADVNARDDRLISSLHLAEHYGDWEVAQMLLNHKADVNFQDDHGRTPLHILLENGMFHGGGDDYFDHVQLLLEHGAEVNRRDKNNQTPLLLAVWQNWFELVDILLENGADANAVDDNAKTPLHILSESQIDEESDVIDLVLLLLNHGSDVNRRDNDNQTTLLLVMERGWFEVARILLEDGADAHMENSDGKTLLHILFESEIDNECDILDLVLLLLEHGAEVNTQDQDGKTALLLVMEREWLSTAQILLELGADANAVDSINGKTLLHVLSENEIKPEDDIIELVLLLLKYGAEVNSLDKDNQTPLHLAVLRQDHLKLAEIFLKHGADANAVNNDGMTPLRILFESWIIEEGDVLNHASILLKYGAEVNSRDEDNETPLHLAIRCNYFKLAKILLDHGADANAKNNNSMTPLHILTKCQNLGRGDALNHVLLLLEHGVEVNSRDRKNDNPSKTPSHN